MCSHGVCIFFLIFLCCDSSMPWYWLYLNCTCQFVRQLLTEMMYGLICSHALVKTTLLYKVMDGQTEGWRGKERVTWGKEKEWGTMTVSWTPEKGTDVKMRRPGGERRWRSKDGAVTVVYTEEKRSVFVFKGLKKALNAASVFSSGDKSLRRTAGGTKTSSHLSIALLRSFTWLLFLLYTAGHWSLTKGLKNEVKRWQSPLLEEHLAQRQGEAHLPSDQHFKPVSCRFPFFSVFAQSQLDLSGIPCEWRNKSVKTSDKKKNELDLLLKYIP